MRFAELTGQEIDSLSREIPVVLPIARTVPRGPALPVGIEAKILESVISQLTDCEFLWLPTPPFAASPAFAGLTGRLATSPNTFSAVISDILQSLLSAGFRRILVLSAEPSLESQTLITLQTVRAENPTSLLFSCSLQALAAADSHFLGHVAAAVGSVVEFAAADIEVPLTPEVPYFILLNRESSPSGSIHDSRRFDPDLGRHLRETARQNLETLLYQMKQPATFQ